MLHLAVALSELEDVKVTVLSLSPEIAKKSLEEFYHLDLSGIDYEIIKSTGPSLGQIVREADLFVPLSNFRRVKGEPKQYVQALQVPYGKITPWTISAKISRGQVKDGLKDLCRLDLLSHAREKSRLTVTNSQFVHDTLLRNFALESEVLHPPIQDFFQEKIKKQKKILSVGRFFVGFYNSKRYDILCAAFRELSGKMRDWEYHIVGSALPGRETTRYIETLKKENAGFPIFFHINEKQENLLRLYNIAGIYWHGAGYGVDENKYPERTEHFGMSVVEAMSARCVPVVVNKGGLREIVNHGVDGFLWDTTDQLIEHTLKVAGLSPDQLDRLQGKARERYQRFTVNNYNRRVAEIFSPILTGSAPGS